MAPHISDTVEPVDASTVPGDHLGLLPWAGDVTRLDLPPGSLISSPRTGSHFLPVEAMAHYELLGGPLGALGAPTSGPLTVGALERPLGYVVRFEHGSVHVPADGGSVSAVVA